MSKQARSDDGRPKDARLGRMVLLSGFVHVGVLGVLYTHGESRHSEPLLPQTYTVSLVAPPATLHRPEPAPPPAAAPPPEPAPPEIQPKKEEPPKPTVEKPEPEKPKVKVTEKKPKQTAVQPEPEKKAGKKKIVVEKKPKPAVEEPAAEPPAPKTAEKPEPKKKAEAPQKPSVEEGPTDEQRDRRILAALEKVRGRVGTAAPAAGTAIRGLPFLLYTSQVKQRVRESWIVAQQKPGASAVVRFGILPSGDIVAIELARGSGDRVFDESVIRAVKKADPLPPPPEAYRHEFTRQKIEVVFGETRAMP